MINKLMDNRKSIGINAIIISSFAAIAIFSVYFLVQENVINGAWDLPFHWGRIYELVSAYRHLDFLPHYNLTAMSGNGTAVMLLYPYITLLPFVLVLLFFKFSITLMYIFFAVVYFEGLIISYYSSRQLSKDNLTSYVFAVLYCTSAIFMSFSFTSMDLGILLALIYMPLVIFGFIDFLRYGKWIELTIGAILIIFSHVLSIILIFSFVFVWFLTDVRKIWKDKAKMINLGKAILTVMTVTSFVWVPAILFLLTNRIKKPINFGMPSSLDILSLMYTSVTNNITLSWGLSVFAVLGFVFVPIFFYHHFSPIIKKMYWLSFAFAIFSTGLFPWEQSLSHTPLSIIQFPWRLDTVPQMLFIYIFATCVTKYIQAQSKPIYVPLVIMVTLACQLSAQKQVINLASREDSHELSRPLFKDDNYYPAYNAKSGQAYLDYHISHSDELDYVIKAEFPVNDYPDYYPEKSFIEREYLSKDLATYGNHKTIKLNQLGNGVFEIDQKHPKVIKDVSLPFVHYNFVNYQVFVNGHKTNFHRDKTHLITLDKLSSDVRQIQVRIIPSKLSYIYNVISWIGGIYLCFSIYKNNRNRRHELRKKL